YLFTMLQRVFFGPLKEPAVMHGEGQPPIADLDLRELSLIAPIMILCVVIGVYPQPVLNVMRPDVDTVGQIATLARERAGEPTHAEAHQGTQLFGMAKEQKP